MNFADAVASGLRNAFTVSGRASRSEFWWFVLFMVLVLVVPVAACLMSGWDRGTQNGVIGTAMVAHLLLGVPECTLATRRLHDIGKSGWWQLVMFVPLGGSLALMWWLLRPGDRGVNRFGPDPLRTAALGAPWLVDPPVM